MAKKMIRSWALIAMFFYVNQLSAQEVDQEKSEWLLSAYVDGYYSLFSGSLPSSDFQNFTTVGPRDGTIGINVAQLGLAYTEQQFRVATAFHFGDIPEANWSNDFNQIQYAYAGINLGNSIWLDAGFFITHLGTESFLPKNNMLSATAYKTWMEAFYQAGLRLSYEGEGNLNGEFWILNGNNLFVDNNSAKSIGVLINYAINDDASFTYTNIYGRENPNEQPDNQYFFFQNAYLNYSFDQWELQAGFDIAFQTNSTLISRDQTAALIGGLITARRAINDQWSVTGRQELYYDPHGILSSSFPRSNSVEPTGVRILGTTIGVEYVPTENAYIRMEGRYAYDFESTPIFKPQRDNIFQLLMTMGISIEKIL